MTVASLTISAQDSILGFFLLLAELWQHLCGPLGFLTFSTPTAVNTCSTERSLLYTFLSISFRFPYIHLSVHPFPFPLYLSVPVPLCSKFCPPVLPSLCLPTIIFGAPGIKPRALHMLGKHSTTELHYWPHLHQNGVL